jgi:hypothetical protein
MTLPLLLDPAEPGTDHTRGALFSACMRYRYRLWRRWDDRPALAFVMLNPSTADVLNNDPTVERCERRARLGGYGALEVANIFALRSTDPRALYRTSDPIGPGNNAEILNATRDAGMVICAWGGHGRLLQRARDVLMMLRAHGVVPHALDINRDGSPAHPLYLPYSMKPYPLP